MEIAERKLLAELSGEPNPTAAVEEAGRYLDSECLHLAPDRASLGLHASLTPPPCAHSEQGSATLLAICRGQERGAL